MKPHGKNKHTLCAQREVEALGRRHGAQGVEELGAVEGWDGGV